MYTCMSMMTKVDDNGGGYENGDSDDYKRKDTTLSCISGSTSSLFDSM